MRGRIEAGAAIAALFLAIGALSASQDWPVPLTGACFLLAGLSIIGAFANRIPLLHRLPIIGSPRLKAKLALEGRGRPVDPDQPIELRISGSAARFALVHLLITNNSRVDVQPASVNFLMTEGIKRCKCDHHGVALNKGAWLPPVKKGDDRDQSPYMDYWAAGDLAFPGHTNVAWWFKVRFQRAGIYRFRLKIGSVLLRDDFEQDFELRVSELSGEQEPVERLDELIDEAEELVVSIAGSEDDDGARRESMAFAASAAEAVPERFQALYDDAAGESTASREGREHHLSQARAKLAVLHDIRRRLGDENEATAAKS